MNRWIATLGLVLSCHGLFADFTSPTKRLIDEVTLETIKYNLKAKKTGLNYREFFDKVIAEEQSGFFGYYGGGVDDLIYQDIIRATVEVIAGIPVRKDFHFLSVPLNNSLTMDELSQFFVKDGYKAEHVKEHTIPLNFALYSNHNLVGLNSVVNFTHNLPSSKKESLKQLFEELGIDPATLDTLYSIAHERLGSNAGILLQLFDTSPAPYAFANTIAYSAYPNGFIAENRTIREYFLDNLTGEFPHEVRLVINLGGILNPTAPITFKRYTKLQASKLKTWEQELKLILQKAPIDTAKRDVWRQTLIDAWEVNHGLN